MNKYKLTSVESFITKHVPIIEHFAIFFSFLNQIKQILCHWMCKLEDYKWHKNGMLWNGWDHLIYLTYVSWAKAHNCSIEAG